MDLAKKVLVIEDDNGIAEILRLHLSDEGYEVTHAVEGSLGAKLLYEQQWDALILDLMLPGVDGLEICRRARAMTHYTPIIIISARTSEVHRVLGLELGADDYLPKPFSVLELIARLKALFRRQEAMNMKSRMEAGTLNLDALIIDPVAREVWLHNNLVILTRREFDLLYYFAKHPGKVFSRLNLLNQVWGYQYDGYEHTVNTHINRLRLKIEVNPAEPLFIKTVWGKGYKFSLPTQLVKNNEMPDA